MINRIEGKLCKTARPLWEEVFYEDSKAFTDYYFENKAEKNIGYIYGTFPYEAMMFRTPYQLQIGKEKREISYIVGVATRKEYRHRGYMRKLLIHSFKEMYREKQPFAFLMPANPAIYEPFDFSYIYCREEWELKNPREDMLRLEAVKREKIDDKDGRIGWKKTKPELTAAEGIKTVQKPELDGLHSVKNICSQMPQYPIMEQLAEFANQYLKRHFQIYVHRDTTYYERQLKESEAQNGDIYVFFEQGEIKAMFLYANEEGEVFLQEVMEAEKGQLDFLQKNGIKKPWIMARIIHLEEMMKLVRSKEGICKTLRIEDELIPENAGIYRWEITPDGSRVTKQKEENRDEKCGTAYDTITGNIVRVPEVSLHIRELAKWVLTDVCINEIV